MNLGPRYELHDAIYVRRRAAGEVGWGSARDIATGHRWLAEATPTWPPGASVLEIGSGAGDQSLWLAARGFAVRGIDISPAAVAWARDKAAATGVRAAFDVGSVLELPYADGTFDVVLDGWCLHCIIGADRARLFAEVARVLRPRGLFRIQSMIGAPPDHVDFDGRRAHAVVDGERFISREIPATVEELVDEVVANGFDVDAWTIDHDDDMDSALVDARPKAGG